MPDTKTTQSKSSTRSFKKPQELRNHFKFVFFMDLRHDAQSNSSVETSRITLDTYLDDIEKVRRTLGLDRIVVLGHSHHGLLALEYARKYPQQTSHVVDNNSDVFLHYQQVILKDYDIAERPGRVETPVFVVIGRYDYVSPYYLWDDRKDVLPNLSYNLFEKSGHFPMVEEEELFDKLHSMCKCNGLFEHFLGCSEV